jgi:hypothetical protein
LKTSDPMSDMQRVVGIVVSPTSTFEDINRRPTWLVPLVLLLISNVAVTFIVYRVIATNANFDAIARAKIAWDAHAAGTVLSPAHIQHEIDALRRQRGLWFVLPPISVVISTLGLTALFYIVFRLQRPHITFKKTFAVVCWSFIIYRCIGGVFTIASLLARGATGFAPAPAEAWSPTSLAQLVPRSSVDPNVYTAISKLDVFLVWWLVVIAIGLSKTVDSLSLRRAGVTVLAAEAIYLLANAAGFLPGTL